MKNNLKRLLTPGHSFKTDLQSAVTMPRARYPVARGTLEKILEPYNHQMSILADVLLNTEENGCYTEYMQGALPHHSCLYKGSEVFQNYKGSFFYLTLSWAILSPQFKPCS